MKSASICRPLTILMHMCLYLPINTQNTHKKRRATRGNKLWHILVCVSHNLNQNDSCAKKWVHTQSTLVYTSKTKEERDKQTYWVFANIYFERNEAVNLSFIVSSRVGCERVEHWKIKVKNRFTIIYMKKL